MNSIALGKERYGMPETEEHQWTHFIRYGRYQGTFCV